MVSILVAGVKESPLVSSVNCSVFRDRKLKLWTVTLGVLCVVGLGITNDYIWLFC